MYKAYGVLFRLTTYFFYHITENAHLEQVGVSLTKKGLNLPLTSFYELKIAYIL